MMFGQINTTWKTNDTATLHDIAHKNNNKTALNPQIQYDSSPLISFNDEMDAFNVCIVHIRHAPLNAFILHIDIQMVFWYCTQIICAVPLSKTFIK